MQIQFWRTDDEPESLREVDMIINQVKQYPRPRMKRQTNEERVRYLLKNLPPYSEIAVQIRVLNKYYVGPPSTPIYFRTLEAGKFDVLNVVVNVPLYLMQMSPK